MSDYTQVFCKAVEAERANQIERWGDDALADDKNSWFFLALIVQEVGKVASEFINSSVAEYGAHKNREAQAAVRRAFQERLVKLAASICAAYEVAEQERDFYLSPQTDVIFVDTHAGAGENQWED